MRRCRTPGLHPDTFQERLRRFRCVEGEHGQYIDWAQSFTGTGREHIADRFGWPVDDLGVPDFDWADGDGINPNQGPVLTATGAPVAGVASPFSGLRGSLVTCTAFVPGTYLSTATAIDPAAGEDMVIIALVRAGIINNYVTIISTRNAGQGWMLYGSDPSHRVLFRSEDNAAFVSSIGPTSIGWTVISVTYDASGDQYLFCNGILCDQDTVSGLGSLAGGNGLGIAARPDGQANRSVDVFRVVFWYGNGIAEIANAGWHNRLSAHVLGCQNVQNNNQPTFTRASSASKQVGVNRHVFGYGAPRSGSAEGLLIEPTRINKVYNNINNQVTTGWTATGGMGLTAQNDAAALLAAGIREFGPNVLQVANATGAAQTVRSGAVTANLNPHSVSVFGRITAGAGARIGLYDNSAGTFQDLGAMTDGYVRTLVHGAVPGDTDRVFALQIPNGCTVRFVMAQLEEGPRCTSPIPNVATAATATRVADVLDTTVTPRDAEGSIECGITPVLWSGTQPGAAGNIVTRTGGTAALVRYSNAGTGRCYTSDGTSNPFVDVAWTDGTRVVARQRYGNGGLSIDVDGARGTSAYDGTLPFAGQIRLESSVVSVLIDSFRIYRNGSW